MGCQNSKIYILNDVNHTNNLDKELIDVKFVNLVKNKNVKINITPEELNDLLGDNIPKFCYEDEMGSNLIYCVLESCNIEEIAEKYGYEICNIYKTSVNKCYFNSKHIPIHFYNKKEYWKLILDI